MNSATARAVVDAARRLAPGDEVAPTDERHSFRVGDHDDEDVVMALDPRAPGSVS